MRLNETGTSGPAATAPRPTTKAGKADPTVTAGEVNGRGQYPGVPGYSALDNWTRSQATGTYSAPDYAVRLLEQAGYIPPVTRVASRPAISGLDTKAAEDLTPYGYKVTEDEAQRILDSYAPDAKGDAKKLAEGRVETKNRAVPMTVEAYNKLSPDQKAAVDFNTALVEAREKDLNSGWMIRTAPKEGADAMRSIFGPDASTGGYPEHTLKLLERIGYKAPGSSLTDFLSLDMAVSADELKDLKLPKDFQFAVTEDKSAKKPPVSGRLPLRTQRPQPAPDPAVARDEYGITRSSENLAMLQLDVIRRASEALAAARTNSMPGWSPASTAVGALGGSMRGSRTPFGWGGADTRTLLDSEKDRKKDGTFQKIFDVLLNDASKTKLAESQGFWAQLKQTGFDEKDVDQLFQYLDQRTRSMMEGGVTPLSGQNDAKVIRELAGLEPVNG